MSRVPQKRRPRSSSATLPVGRQPMLAIGKFNFVLRNLSEGGMAVWVPNPKPPGFAPGQRYKGEIRLGNDRFSVEVEVRHHESPRVAGFSFHRIDDSLRRILLDLLEPGNAADGMALVDGPAEDPKTGFHRLVYRSPAGGDLVLWYQPGVRMILALQVIWGDNWIYRRQFKPVETGRLKPKVPRPLGHVQPPEAFVAPSVEPDMDLVDRAAQLLSALDQPIPGNVLWQFLESGEQTYLPEGAIPRVRAA